MLSSGALRFKDFGPQAVWFRVIEFGFSVVGFSFR